MFSLTFLTFKTFLQLHFLSSCLVRSMFLRRYDIQHNNMQHDDTQHNKISMATLSIMHSIYSFVMLSVIKAKCGFCWVSLCQMSLWWVSLYWMSWHHFKTMKLVNLNCFKSLLLNTVTQKHFLYSTSLQSCHFYSLQCQFE